MYIDLAKLTATWAAGYLGMSQAFPVNIEKLREAPSGSEILRLWLPFKESGQDVNALVKSLHINSQIDIEPSFNDVPLGVSMAVSIEHVGRQYADGLFDFQGKVLVFRKK
jgi:hypothetical protein